MNPKDHQQWQRISEEFHALVDLPSEAQQQRLKALEAEDGSLYQAVVELLDQEKALHPALQTRATASWDLGQDEALVGTDLGPYRLTQLLGSGGMGSVFLAERNQEDFEQTVALKLIRPGGFTEDAIERFRQERQILASLAHPHIARLYDGGQTEEGRLFFTMERVEGKDLLSFLEHANLDVRIDLFLQLCKAIAYAHTRLVLHLDLKPSNILVNDQGEVKVLDFGVAEKFDVSTVDFSPHPSGSRRYTLAYGAPEQLLGHPVSTRTDLYSLGVLLYEILTGRLPIEVGTASYAQDKQKLVNQPILPPSQKVDSARLRGDLDAIVMTCLARNPDERYASVEQLIADLEAWKQQRPISLRRNERGYVAQKFLRRNRSWLTGVAVAVSALLFLGTFYTIRLQQERNRALNEAQKNEQLLSFVTDIFQKADPFIAQGDTLTVYDLLGQAQTRVETELTTQPGLYAEMMKTLGAIYLALNEYERADSLVQRALTTMDDHPDLRETVLHGELLFLKSDLEYGLGKYEEAEQTARKGLAIDLTLGPQGNPARFYQLLGNLANEQFHFERADSLFQQTKALYLAELDSSSAEVAGLLHSLGDLKRRMRQYDSAELYSRAALRSKQQLYQAPHTELAYTLNHLASLYLELGQLDTALYYAQQSLHQRRIVLGDTHIETIASLGNVGRILDRLGRYEESIPLKQEMVAATTRLFPEAHPYQIASFGQLGRSLLAEDRYDEAEAAYEESVSIFQQLIANGQEEQYAYPGVIAYQGMGMTLFQQGRFEASLSNILRAIDLNERLGDPGSVMSIRLVLTLGQLYLRLGDVEAGRAKLEETRTIIKQQPQPNQAWLDLIEEELGE